MPNQGGRADESHGEGKMIITKYAKLTVLCQTCDAAEHPGPFIKNYDRLICDICGNVRSKVTYIAEERANNHDVKRSLPECYANGKNEVTGFLKLVSQDNRRLCRGVPNTPTNSTDY